jgi:hypothetical protein
MGLEGIVSKRLSAPYRSGPSRDWIKIKNPDSPASCGLERAQTDGGERSGDDGSKRDGSPRTWRGYRSRSGRSIGTRQARMDFEAGHAPAGRAEPGTGRGVPASQSVPRRHITFCRP